MFERVSLDEARHILTDFFEIHTEARQSDARKRAFQLLDEMDAREMVCLGMLPTLRVGKSMMSYVPENYDPDEILIVRKRSNGKAYSKKVRLKK